MKKIFAIVALTASLNAVAATPESVIADVYAAEATLESMAAVYQNHYEHKCLGVAPKLSDIELVKLGMRNMIQHNQASTAALIATFSAEEIRVLMPMLQVQIAKGIPEFKKNSSEDLNSPEFCDYAASQDDLRESVLQHFRSALKGK